MEGDATMNDHNAHLLAPTSSRLTRFAAGVAAARRAPTFDAGRVADTLPGEMHASQMPPGILRAIAASGPRNRRRGNHDVRR